MAEERLVILIGGRVQGVGFRWHTLRQARQLGLTGRVANRRDGTVEVVAEGQRAALEGLLAWARQGPPSSHVDRCAERWQPATGEHDTFEITR